MSNLVFHCTFCCHWLKRLQSLAGMSVTHGENVPFLKTPSYLLNARRNPNENPSTDAWFSKNCLVHACSLRIMHRGMQNTCFKHHFISEDHFIMQKCNEMCICEKYLEGIIFFVLISMHIAIVSFAFIHR